MKKQIPDIGEKAPDFTVQDSDGNQFHLAKALSESTFLLLVFYRGHW